jgi:hypothetical protein
MVILLKKKTKNLGQASQLAFYAGILLTRKTFLQIVRTNENIRTENDPLQFIDFYWFPHPFISQIFL